MLKATINFFVINKSFKTFKQIQSPLKFPPFQQSDLHIRYNSTLGRTHLRGIRRIPSNLYTTRATPVAEDDPIEASSELKVRAVAPPYYQRQQVQDHAGTPPSFPIAVAPQASAPPASVRNQFAPLLEQQKTQEERREVRRF